MKRFADLYLALEEPASASHRIELLKTYFTSAPAEDAAWAVHFLLGGTIGKAASAAELRQWSSMAAGIPPWLFDECRKAAGNASEAVSLLLPEPAEPCPDSLAQSVAQALKLRTGAETERRDGILAFWRHAGRRERLVWTKMLRGDLRFGTTRRSLARALSEIGGIDRNVMACRLAGYEEPGPDRFLALLRIEDGEGESCRPCAFASSVPLESLPDTLGDFEKWSAEWNWDGKRAQIVKRGDSVHLWSRGGDLLTGAFPEIAASAAAMPGDVVLDGEILAWDRNAPLPSAALGKRIASGDRGATSAVFMAFDALEIEGKDLRQSPLSIRRGALETLLASSGGEAIRLSPQIHASSWDDLTARRAGCRMVPASGLMLKALDSTYAEKTRPWRVWKLEPHTVDAVLIYAQAGREMLYTDCTFGVWQKGALVPIARMQTGLTGDDALRIDSFVRQNTLERFGPVRSVKPELVFEIGFEGVERSARRKSGLAVRLPRVVRRKEKLAEEADSVEALRRFLREGG